MSDPVRIKQLKEKISSSERQLQKMMSETERIWEETGLDPKDSSYMVEKTMRFELAQKNIVATFSSFKDLVGNYRKLCDELEKTEQ